MISEFKKYFICVLLLLVATTLTTSTTTFISAQTTTTTTTVVNATNTTLLPGFHGTINKADVVFSFGNHDFTKTEAAGILFILLALAFSILVAIYWFTCRDHSKDESARQAFEKKENKINEPYHVQQQQQPRPQSPQQRYSAPQKSAMKAPPRPPPQPVYFEHGGYQYVKNENGTFWWSAEHQTWFPCE